MKVKDSGTVIELFLRNIIHDSSECITGTRFHERKRKHELYEIASEKSIMFAVP